MKTFWRLLGFLRPYRRGVIVSLVADGRELTFSYPVPVTVEEFLEDAEVTLGNLDQGTQAGAALPCAQPAQSCRNQRPVVGVQWDQIRHRPDRDQIEQTRQIRAAVVERTGPQEEGARDKEWKAEAHAAERTDAAVNRM